MLADAGLAQIGLADIPSSGLVAIPPLFPTNLLASASASLLFGTETPQGLSGGKGGAQLTGIDSVANLIGSKKVDQLN